MCILTSLVAQSVGLVIGCAVDAQAAVYLGPISTIPTLLFSGDGPKPNPGSFRFFLSLQGTSLWSLQAGIYWSNLLPTGCNWIILTSDRFSKLHLFNFSQDKYLDTPDTVLARLAGLIKTSRSSVSSGYERWTTQQLNNQPPHVFRFLRLPGQHPVVHAVDVVRGLREVRLRGHHARHIRLRQRDARVLTGALFSWSASRKTD